MTPFPPFLEKSVGCPKRVVIIVTEITRHFTATTFVVYNGKLLLHFHKKLKMWLPPGGHIDRDELPEEAAVREIKEETGLEVTLIHGKEMLKTAHVKELLRPHCILLEDINEHHQHIDFIYFAVAENDILKPQDGESVVIKWFTKDELLLHTEITEDIKVLGKRALESC